MKINRCCVRIRIYVAPWQRCCVTMLGSSVFLRAALCESDFHENVGRLQYIQSGETRDVKWRAPVDSGQTRWWILAGKNGLKIARSSQAMAIVTTMHAAEPRTQQKRETYKSRLLCVCASSPSEFFFTRALRNNWVRGISSRRLFIFTDLMMGGSFYRAKHSFQIPNNWFIPHSIFCAPAALSLRCCCCVRWWANFLPAACASTQIPACIFHRIYTHTGCQLLIMGLFTQIYCWLFHQCFGLMIFSYIIACSLNQYQILQPFFVVTISYFFKQCEY